MANTKDPKSNPAVDKANENANLPDHVGRVKKDWDDKRKGGSIVVARNPRNNASLVLTKMEFEGNVVRVWTSDHNEAEPQYVIVNPRTKYPVGDQLIEDPLSALAISITEARAQ